MSNARQENVIGRWIIYLVAAIVAAFIIEYAFGGGSAGYAIVVGIATGLAADVADAIIVYA